MEYVPTVFVYKNIPASCSNQRNARYQRSQRRRQQQFESALKEAEIAAAESLLLMAEPEPDPEPESMVCNSATQTDVVEYESDHTQTCKVTLKESGVQASTRTANVSSQTESVSAFSAVYLESSDKDHSMLKFYTGLPSWKIFHHISSILVPYIPKKWSLAKLKPEDEFLLVLMRLRLNLLLDDISYRFCIARPTVISIQHVD